MNIYDLRDPDQAKRYLLEGLLYSVSAPIDARSVENGLFWAMEIVSEGSPLPCLGLVMDIGMIATNQNVATFENSFENEISRDVVQKRQYEDYVIGKMFSDFSFERAGNTLSKYEGRDNHRAVAYIVNKIFDRADLNGAKLSLAVVKSLQELSFEEVLKQAVELVSENGWSESIAEDFGEAIVKIRNTGELLGREDVFELEQGTALAEYGQRVALRQVLRTSAELEEDLPSQRPSVPPRKYSVATNIMEEDFYPIGGFTSISNKGTIESLLRSELAYLEDSNERPDLFDIKYVRDELLYYSRDENQFLRRRLSFLFLFDANLVTARFKDAELPVQRIILLMAFLVAAVQKLLGWLSDDAIVFEFVFVEEVGRKSLEDEKTLFETLFREQIDNGVLKVNTLDLTEVEEFCDDHGRQSLCHATVLSATKKSKIKTGQFAIPSKIILDQASPKLRRDEELDWRSEDTGMEAWIEMARVMTRYLV